MTIFQEQYPSKARTFRSAAEAFHTPEYVCAIQRFPKRTLLRRVIRFFFGPASV